MKLCKTNDLGQFKKATMYYFLYYLPWRLYRKYQNELYHWDRQMFFPYIQRSIEKDRKLINKTGKVIEPVKTN